MVDVATRRTRARNAIRRAARAPGHSEPATPDARALLLRTGWSPSWWPGRCIRCRTPFYPPQAIKHVPTTTPGDEYRADCCPGDDHA